MSALFERSQPLVFVVNDDPIFLATIAEILQDEGYRAACRAIDQDPFSAICAQLPGLLIIDFPYQQRPAWALLDQLDAEPCTQLIPIIASSTDPGNLATFGARAMSRRRSAVLIKPFELDPLIELVRSFVPSPV